MSSSIFLFFIAVLQLFSCCDQVEQVLFLTVRRKVPNGPFFTRLNVVASRSYRGPLVHFFMYWRRFPCCHVTNLLSEGVWGYAQSGQPATSRLGAPGLIATSINRVWEKEKEKEPPLPTPNRKKKMKSETSFLLLRVRRFRFFFSETRNGRTGAGDASWRTRPSRPGTADTKRWRRDGGGGGRRAQTGISISRQLVYRIVSRASYKVFAHFRPILSTAKKNYGIVGIDVENVTLYKDPLCSMRNMGTNWIWFLWFLSEPSLS